MQDQLLKAGLSNKKQAKKARHEKRAKRKKNKRKKVAPQINQTQQEAIAQAKRSQVLSRQINQETARLENLTQIKQLIELNRLNLDKYEEPYYVAVGKKIKKLYVNDEITKKLSCGQLAIVTAKGTFEIVPAQVGQQIAASDQESLVLLHEPKN